MCERLMQAMPMNRFLDFMRLDSGNDDEDDDDGYVNDVDEEEDRRSRRNKRNSRYDDDDDEDEEHGSLFRSKERGQSEQGRRSAAPQQRLQPGRPLVDAGQEVRVFKPTNLDEARKVTDTLLNRQSAVLNLEGLDLMMAQRIIDFVGGSNYAIHGHFTRISNFIFLFTPRDVDIAGDISENAEAADVQRDAPTQQPAGNAGLNFQFGQQN
jgi:cell division inhibitor SepF